MKLQGDLVNARLGGHMELQVAEHMLHRRLPLGVFVPAIQVAAAGPFGDVDEAHLGVIDEGARACAAG